MFWLRVVLPALVLLLGVPASAQPPTLPDLAGPVILTVSGLAPDDFPDGSVELDLGRLATIGIDEIETSTIWTTEGVHRFKGVMLRDLIEFLGIDAKTLNLHALNDYVVEIPVDEITDAAPILAYEMDNVVMTVRDKGPVWVMYPFDSGSEYRTDTTFSRSVWQLDRIEVLD